MTRISLPILYARTARGQVQQWQIIVNGGTFFTEEGIKEGVITRSKPTVCEPKNVGRANETDAEEQAYKEALSKWQKKLDEGYYTNEADIDKPKFFEPMLAEKWKDYKEDTVFPVFSQPKLDGLRCITSSQGMYSRKGKPIKSAPHILRLLERLFDKYDVVLDGEIYSHKLKADFNKIISLARKTKPTKDDLIESEQKLEYWVYDCFDPSRPDMKFSERNEFLKQILSEIGDTFGRIRFVYTKKVHDEQALNSLFAEYVNEGFEGQMVRWDEPYLNKRTKFLLKRKDFMEEEFILEDVEEGAGDRAGLATIAYLRHTHGTEVRNGHTCFKAGIIGNSEYARELLVNKKKYCGKPATVVFFQYTPDNVPRFAKLKIVRNYE